MPGASARSRSRFRRFHRVKGVVASARRHQWCAAGTRRSTPRFRPAPYTRRRGVPPLVPGHHVNLLARHLPRVVRADATVNRQLAAEPAPRRRRVFSQSTIPSTCSLFRPWHSRSAARPFICRGAGAGEAATATRRFSLFQTRRPGQVFAGSGSSTGWIVVGLRRAPWRQPGAASCGSTLGGSRSLLTCAVQNVRLDTPSIPPCPNSTASTRAVGQTNSPTTGIRRFL